MNHILISATSRSSGKTIITMGLSAALAKRGLKVQTFKKGPDYIDPLWLSAASGRVCRNLDYNTMNLDEICNNFIHHAQGMDVCCIEGNTGLYDGLDPRGSDCTAALAALLDAPVLLVFNAHGVTRGIAPLILGYQQFAQKINFAGIVFNKVAGSRHESKLKAAVEGYTDLTVLGAVRRSAELDITERHLGLIPPNESSMVKNKIATIAKLIADQLDLKILLEKSAYTPTTPTPKKPAASVCDVRIAVANDAAFGFYYADDMEGLRAAGAEIVTFNTLGDAKLPKVDGLFIGGGFPETQMPALEANAALKADIKAVIENGMPAYAECGGLMYLSRSISWHGQRCEMANVIAADAVIHDKPAGKGYVRLRETGKGLWPLLNANGQPGEFPAHEFHYATLENIDKQYEFAYQMLRGEGLGKGQDGIVYKNLMASFIHQRDVKNNRWARRFVDFVRSRKTGANNAF